MWSHPGKLAIAFLLLGVVMYFGLSIVPREIKPPAAMTGASSKEDLPGKETLKEAEKELEPVQKAELDTLMKRLEGSENDSAKSSLLKRVSGFWFDHGRFELAGDYATRVARIIGTGEAWGIAGTTYLQGVDPDQTAAAACREKAIRALEEAIGKDPDNPQHQMNRALCLVRIPGENPMEGIMMLRELDKKYPSYLPVQITLSQLAIQTGQFDKAYDRLKRALTGNPENRELNCLMLELIRTSGRKEPTTALEKACGQ